MDFILNEIFAFLKNLISHDKNITTLKRKLDDLYAVKVDNESKWSEERQPRKKLKKQAERWFQKVERTSEILNDLEELERSNFLKRVFHGSKVLKWGQEVEELIQEGRSYDGLTSYDPQWIGQVLSATNLCGKVVESIMEEIWGYLMDDDVSKIGVWGMGGIGKTTIMKLINNQLLRKTEKFDTVIWITVSKEMDIFKIQKGISRAMRQTLSEDEDETIRAGMLNEMLTRKGRYVLILDDLWDKLSLEKVGIPEPSHGSKLVVTTRKLDVCRCLGCREVKVLTLPEEDARSLFSMKVGGDVLNDPVLSPTVEAVVEQCAGLPLAIVTVASTMKGKCDIHEWKNALVELKRRAQSVNNLDGKVLQQLKFSYDYLENERVKQCFLCCALWPEDQIINIDELIEFWIAEGLVEELESMQEEIDRGRTILNKLINNCLLVKDFGSFVKLHDLVRDMALDITTKGKPRFLVRAGMQLKEIPHLKEWAEDLDTVSLMGNLGMKIPPQMSPPKCPALTTLLLASCYIRSIPECFFEQMHGLKILDLSGNPIESLPNSISDLENLTALLLEGCLFLENMPSFSKLRALEKLNLSGTRLRNFPDGMERLVKLKYLNLTDTCITKISDGILSKFSCLEQLEGYDEYEGRERFMRGDEIGGLRKLEIFKGRFWDMEELSNYVQALNGQTQGPREYHIVVGYDSNTSYYRYKKCIKLVNCSIYRNGAKFPSAVQLLFISGCGFEFGEEVVFSRLIPAPHPTFSALTVIKIYGCKNIKKLFSSDWVLKNLQNLEELCVCDCDELEEIIASSASELEEEGMDSSNTLNLALPKLRKLVLSELPELKSIYSSEGAMVCDSLRIFEIMSCPKLKRIPLYLPLLEEGRPSPPPSLQKISMYPKESWENMEWDHPYAKSLLEPFVKF